jgi:hypothetical protein
LARQVGDLAEDLVKAMAIFNNFIKIHLQRRFSKYRLHRHRRRLTMVRKSLHATLSAMRRLVLRARHSRRAFAAVGSAHCLVLGLRLPPAISITRTWFHAVLLRSDSTRESAGRANPQPDTDSSSGGVLAVRRLNPHASIPIRVHIDWILHQASVLRLSVVAHSSAALD